MSDTPLIRVMALHALAYCERLFYLEEVEEIRVADHRVYAGRTLHEGIDKDEEWKTVTLESEAWGLQGKVDYVRHRDGGIVAYEHKRGRSKGDEAWDSDRLQVTAYCALLAEHLERPVTEGRIRYHASNKSVRVPVDSDALEGLRRAVARARELAASIDRPPPAGNDNLCIKCSLAPVCLPEEERLLRAPDEPDQPKPQRLFPADEERLTLHIVDYGTRVGKSGEQIVVTPKEGEPRKIPGHDVAAIVLHGGSQISTQLLHYCAAHHIAVHWLTAGGAYVGGLLSPGGVQRRLRQFRGLSDEELALHLCRRLVHAKVENQLGFLIRSARKRELIDEVKPELDGIRAALRRLEHAADRDTLRGHEGDAGRRYFAVLPRLLDDGAELMRFDGRNRRPPRDPFNAALSYGYSLLYRDAMTAVHCVGLDPSVGFFHQPRSAAYPLALDLMELFRVTLWDMPLIASVNRGQWKEEDFVRSRNKVWLSPEGKKRAIQLYEKRKQERWKHPVLEYSLSYARAMELEVRLLEKEWTGSPGLFANMRIR